MPAVTILVAGNPVGQRRNWQAIPRVGDQLILGPPHAPKGEVVDVVQVVWMAGADGDQSVDLYCRQSAFTLPPNSTRLEVNDGTQKQPAKGKDNVKR